MAVNKLFWLIIFGALISLNLLYSQMQENDTLPQDLKDLLYNHLNETFELDKKYNINYFQNYNMDSYENNLPRFELEEINLNEFDKPFNFFSYGNNVFLSVNKFSNVITRWSNLSPEININIPNNYQNKVLKVVNIGTNKSKSDVLEEIMLKYNLRYEKSKIKAKVLEIDYSSFKESPIPEIDSIQFNSLGGYTKNNIFYSKDIKAEDLEYSYYFYTHQHLKIINSENIIIKYLKLDISNKEILDNQLMEYFTKNKFITVEQDFITITEKN